MSNYNNDLLIEQGNEITALKARVAELEAWQTGVCALIQTASMDGQSILPHELTDAIYHP